MALRNIWPIAYNAPKDMPILHFIHPLKQRSVAELIKHTEKNFPDVVRLIIFGSAVTNACHQGSDVDVIAIGGEKFYSCDCDVYDIVDIKGMHPDSAFIKRVLSEGVIVYDTEPTT